MPPTNRILIKVHQLTKKYGHEIVVDSLSFDVYENEIFGFLGPNGAGKSTTLEILETLKRKTSGHISIAGYDIDTQPSDIKRVIGIQLQSSAFYRTLNLTDIIRLFAGLYNVDVSPKTILMKVGLQEKAKKTYKQLSGGQQQRFAIAITLINKPKIIFLDEPTTGLDPQARRSLWKVIQALRDEGVTIMLTTHYMDEAEFLCDRIAIIDHGKLLDIDTPDCLIDKLLATGFSKEIEVKKANLEDVFLHMTGHGLRND